MILPVSPRNSRKWRAPRRPVLGLWLLALLTGLLTSCTHQAAVRWPKRPNVVLLVVDDLDATFTPFLKAMPNTKKLFDEHGTTFTNSFATNPLCCPARASILTGMYPHNDEVYDSVYGLDNFKARGSNKTMGVRLQDAGYRTAYIGKYLNGYELDPSYVPPGWDDWFGLAGEAFLSGYAYQANHNGTMESYGRTPKDYQTDVMSREATRFIGPSSKAKQQPFLLTLWTTAPHDYIPPAPRDEKNEFTAAEVPKRPNFDEADVSDKPLWLKNGYHRLTAAEKEQQTERYRRRLGSLLAVDDMVGSIEKRLRANGQFDNTDFVFVSDNGFSFGSHRALQKLIPYEESIRVPLMMAGPGIKHGTSDAMVTHLDIAPTIYDLAGIPIPDDVDGRSLRPVLSGGKPPWRKDFLIDFNGTYSAFVQIHTEAETARYFRPDPGLIEVSPDYRGLRTERWLYVQWYKGPPYEYELYDLKADPYEMTNLVAHPAGAKKYAATTSTLQKRLDTLKKCDGKVCR